MNCLLLKIVRRNQRRQENIFCFASGELGILNDEQIEGIRYLSAMVSAVSGLSFLESLSFHLARQMFTRLSTRMDVISSIALLYFSGPSPTE